MPSAAAGTNPTSAMKPDTLIRLKVPAATKGRWVRASRNASMRLTDWITEIVEEHMSQVIDETALRNALENCPKRAPGVHAEVVEPELLYAIWRLQDALDLHRIDPEAASIEIAKVRQGLLNAQRELEQGESDEDTDG